MVKYDLPAIMNQQGCQQQPLRIFAENCPRLATTLEPTAVAGLWEKHGLVKYRYGHLFTQNGYFDMEHDDSFHG